MRMRQMAKDIDEKIEELKKTFINSLVPIINILKKRVKNYLKNLKMNLKKEFAKELKTRDDKIEKLESDKVMLQKHILEIKKQNLTNQSEIEELEQYG